ncbi:IS66 family transposase [Thiothrix litoralis]|uniref:IS66 family transposase n=1 Tax=Thiothrix litoralis TaxID=2891210 RepID=A0ABX7WRE5_9GAMM|nr:IS66 family transposase [Thiothrix litoralis]QTR45801.1 IS66 family transposase [Thiothrix litoralis]
MNQLPRPTRESLQQLSHADLVELVLMLFERIDQLTARVNELESQANKNSKNSHKPPSSDGLKRQPAQPRQLGQRPKGGQPGHKGHSLMMHPSPDHVEHYGIEGHCECGLPLSEALLDTGERRQQWDIPAPQIVVTEYRQLIGTCSCGNVHKGKFPTSLPPYISYGARLKAYTVGLVQGHFISLSRVTEIVSDQYGVKPSDGSVQRWIGQASENLATTYTDIRDTISSSAVANFDESGIRAQGKTQWLHVAATPEAVYYTAHARRGQEAMTAAGILPVFQGVAVHDHWKPYFRFDHVVHSLCVTHLLRELNYFDETLKHQWPAQLKQVLIDAKTAVAQAKAVQQTSLSPEQIADVEQRYDQWLNHGLLIFPEQPKTSPTKQGKAKQDPARNLLCRLRDFKDSVLRFIQRFDVPFDNNLAERAVRPVKVKLKVAGGFRAMGGADAFCVIRSVWETDKLQERNPFESLRAVFG